MKLIVYFKDHRKVIFFLLVLIITLSTSLRINTKLTDIFIQAKQFQFFFSASILLLLSGLVLFVEKQKFRLKLNYIDYFVFAFLAYNLFLILFSESVSFSNKFFVLTLLSILYYLVKSFLENSENLRKFINALLLIIMVFAIIHLLWGLSQILGLIPLIGTTFRVEGAFGNPGPYSNFLIPSIVLSISHLFFAKHKGRLELLIRYLCFATILLAIIVLPFTHARTAWLTIILFTIIVIFRWGKTKLSWFKNIRKGIYHSILAISFLAFLGLVFILYSYKKDSADGRMIIWGRSLEIIKDNPVTGVGINKFTYHYNNYQAEYFKKHPQSNYLDLADNATYAFNDFLQIAIETGILGLVIFLFPIGWLLKKEFLGGNIGNHPAIVYYLALLSILFSGLFSYPLQSIPTQIVFYLLLAILSFQVKSITVIPQKGYFNRAVGIVLIVLAVLFSLYQKRTYVAHKKWKEVSTKVKSTNNPDDLKDYENLYPALQNNSFFLFNYGSELYQRGNYDKSVEVLEQAENKLSGSDYFTYLGAAYSEIGEWEDAERALLQACYTTPIRQYPKYMLVYVYLNTRRIPEAVKMAREVLDMKEKVKSKTTDEIEIDLIRIIREYEKEKANSQDYE